MIKIMKEIEIKVIKMNKVAMIRSKKERSQNQKRIILRLLSQLMVEIQVFYL